MARGVLKLYVCPECGEQLGKGAMHIHADEVRHYAVPEFFFSEDALLSDEAVERLAERLYNEQGVSRPAALTWSATVDSVRVMYRQDARAHLKDLAASLKEDRP